MLKGLLYALASGCAYGMLAIIIKLGYRAGLGEGELLSYRFLGATLILGCYLLIRHPRMLRARPVTLLKAAILGVGFYNLQSICYFKALTFIPASTSTLILYIYPLAVTVLSVLLLRFRVTVTTWISLGLVILGCACVFSDAFQRALPPIGIALAVSAMLIYSLYLIAIQFFLRGEHPLTLTFYAILFSGLTLSIIHPPLRPGALSMLQIGLLLAIALIPTVFAITFLVRAIEEIGSAYTSLFSTVEPIVTIFSAHALLQEHIALSQIIGMLLIIGGIIYPNIMSLKENQAQRQTSG